MDLEIVLKTTVNAIPNKIGEYKSSPVDSKLIVRVLSNAVAQYTFVCQWHMQKFHNVKFKIFKIISGRFLKVIRIK